MLPPAFGGGALRAYRYAKRLDSRDMLGLLVGEEVKGNLDEVFELSDVEKVKKTKVVVLNRWSRIQRKFLQHGIVGYFISALRLVGLYLSLALCFRRHKDSFDIVHCFGAGNWLSLFAVNIGRLLDKKTILEMTLLGSDDPVIISRQSNNLGLRVRSWFFSRADLIVSKSPALTSVYKNTNLDVNKLVEIYNPVDTEKFYPISENEKRKLRSDLDVKFDGAIILYVGFIIRRKGIDLLIESFGRIVQTYPQAALVLVGPVGPHREDREFLEEIRRRLEILGIKQKVVFKGLVNNVNEYMRASDIFVFPSTREGFPNVVVEAMATGLPVVSLNIEGITDSIIEDGFDGIIVDESCSEKFSFAIKRLLEDETFRSLLASNARKKIINRFSTNMIDSDYLQLYQRLMHPS
jgi:glycosyltransferase involved in cell wall biosynthesis